YGLYVIEDVAQSLGATYFYKGQNRQAGTMGHIGCTSFFPSKNLGCFGDGGACFTNDVALAQRMKIIAAHGSVRPYMYDLVGIKSRLDTLQAAVLNAKLPYLDTFIAERRALEAVYDQILKEVDQIDLPVVQENARHTYNQYTLRVKNGQREDLMHGLHKMGIP